MTCPSHIPRIQSLLTASAATTLVQASANSCLTYGNSFLLGPMASQQWNQRYSLNKVSQSHTDYLQNPPMTLNVTDNRSQSLCGDAQDLAMYIPLFPFWPHFLLLPLSLCSSYSASWMFCEHARHRGDLRGVPFLQISVWFALSRQQTLPPISMRPILITIFKMDSCFLALLKLLMPF